MLAVERRHALTELLDQSPVLAVEELAHRFAVSTQTIRRDFQYLERHGLVTRAYGAAVARVTSPLRPLGHEGVFAAREGERAAQKEAIARCALAHIQPGSTVIFDASTTVLAFARLLPLDITLTAIVNALPIANELARRPNVTTTIVGGTLRQTSLSSGGPLAEMALRRLFADTAFISARGLSPARGLTEANPSESALKEIMIANANRIVALIDSSKLGQTALSYFAALERVTLLITDNEADAATVGLLRGAGIEVLIAPPF